MTTLKIATWAFVAVVGVLTAFLAWQNRASEKVATNLPTALAVSVVGALVTLLFSLQSESRVRSFAVEYVLDPATGLPFSCPFVPESSQYTDAGGRSVFGAWLEAAPLLPQIVPAMQKADDARVIRLYRSVLLRQMLETLRFTFLKSWDADPSRFELPTGGGQVTVDIAAVLLGSGVRLFDRLAGTPVVLGNPTVISGVGVTHLRYPVRKA